MLSKYEMSLKNRGFIPILGSDDCITTAAIGVNMASEYWRHTGNLLPAGYRVFWLWGDVFGKWPVFSRRDRCLEHCR